VCRELDFHTTRDDLRVGKHLFDRIDGAGWNSRLLAATEQLFPVTFLEGYGDFHDEQFTVSDTV